MNVCYKHPDSDEVGIVVFSERLAEGETLASVFAATPPAVNPVIVRWEPEGDLDPEDLPQLADAAVNTDDVDLPENGLGIDTVPADEGVELGVSGGLDGYRYFIELAAVTSTGRKIAAELELVVGVQY